MAANNNSLGKAKKAKKDEFYTQLPDIEKELRHYEHHFKDKVVLCNCDDPKVSNFFVYFVRNFKHLGLNRLITTCYKNNEPTLFSNNDSEQAVYLIYDGGDDNNPDPVKVSTTAVPLNGDGDFRSMECIELLKQADIVVTNPPFSLFREYVAQLIRYEKKFLIIGNQNNISYKEIFPLIQSNQIWLGYNSGQHEFEVPLDFEKDNTYIRNNGKKYAKFGNICWFTNLEHSKRHEEIDLYRTYNEEQYPRYVNYDAINVAKVQDIPYDYDGKMGVPITYMEKYCPEQFEIIGFSLSLANMDIIKRELGKVGGGPRFYIREKNGKLKRLFERLVIKKKQQ
ncbi:MAG: adenine-specific methyltransferase EcoRI family protein [Bacteroidaceae bacterium]|nr:adenine-specific methyltransferase EcoRI family protein [Bacteroidaceae bacterium]